MAAQYIPVNEEERVFLETYDRKSFACPSVAADIVVFSVLEDEACDVRRDPVQTLRVLLIRRGAYPYRGYWALPGGFAAEGEDLQETAGRELYEETGIRDAYLRSLGVFGKEDRDPRGWIISASYMALFPAEEYRLRAGTDAWEARWFKIGHQKREEAKENGKTVYHTLKLECEEEKMEIELLEKIRIRGNHKISEIMMLQGDGIAFDHGEILLKALLSLKKQVENEPEVIFDMMPELFTLSRLQANFETVLDRKLLTANFRRSMAAYVEETDQVIQGKGHRPAKLFRRAADFFD